MTKRQLRHAISIKRTVAGVGALAVLGFGGSAFAGLGDSSGTARTDAVTTDSSTYDSTVLTKYIAGRSFVPDQGPAATSNLIDPNGDTCVQPNVGSTDTEIDLLASVELPDGARIKQVVFYGEDNDATDIDVALYRGEFDVPSAVGAPTRADTTVTSFTTAGVTGIATVASADNLNEVSGTSAPGVVGSTTHRFYGVRVQLTTAALANHVLCGVEVRYQIPVSATGTGSVFTPIEPIRAYDSRQAAYTPNGVLAPNTSRVIDISAAHNAAGTVITPNVVPATATAITYNITIASPTGPNFVSVTSGTATSFTASAINFNGTSDVANAATVTIAPDRTIKLWGGDQAGSAHVIIDVTGYYAPATYPNMAG